MLTRSSAFLLLSQTLLLFAATAVAQEGRGPQLSLPRLELGAASLSAGLAASTLPTVAQASVDGPGARPGQRVDWSLYEQPEVPRAKLWVARVLSAVGLGLTVGGVAGAWAWGRRGVCRGEHPVPHLQRAMRTGGGVAGLGVASALVGVSLLFSIPRAVRRAERDWARDLGISGGAAVGAAVGGLALVSVATLGPWVRCSD